MLDHHISGGTLNGMIGRFNVQVFTIIDKYSIYIEHFGVETEPTNHRYCNIFGMYVTCCYSVVRDTRVAQEKNLVGSMVVLYCGYIRVVDSIS